MRLLLLSALLFGSCSCSHVPPDTYTVRKLEGGEHVVWACSFTPDAGGIGDAACVAGSTYVHMYMQLVEQARAKQEAEARCPEGTNCL